MKTILFNLLMVFALSSFATQAGDTDILIQRSGNIAFADSTYDHNPPEGIEKTEPHFEIKGHKFWIVIDNKRSQASYDESSEIYQYFNQTPKSFFNFTEGVTHAAFFYKDSKNIYAVVEVATK